MKLSLADRLLVVGGTIAGLTALWHLLIIAGGPGWYVFSRAPRYIVDSAVAGTWLAPVAAVVVASLMFACAAYAFSGAGLIRNIPLLKMALFIIALICLVRGLFLSPVFFSVEMLGVWHLIASSVWFFVGVCFLSGAVKNIKAVKNY